MSALPNTESPTGTAIPDSAKQELKFDERIHNLLDYIHNNKTTGINNDELSARVGLTVPSMIGYLKTMLVPLLNNT